VPLSQPLPSTADAFRAFRPNRRPLWIAVVANAVLFGTLVVFPYLRGQARCREARDHFSLFAECLWGGRATAQPGLELPEGEAERYAHKVLHAGADWPARCLPRLRAVAPAKAILIFPGIKQAEVDVRAATELVAEELRTLARARRAGTRQVPRRPLLATGRLLAALATMHEAAGVTADMAAPCLRFRGPLPLPAPARVPVEADAAGAMRLSARQAGLDVAAMDARRLVTVGVGSGSVTIERSPRPGLVQTMLAGPRGPWLVWATPEERCAREESGCAHRATGLAAFEIDHGRAPAPRWFAAHAMPPIERSILLDRHFVHVLAAGSEGAAVVSRFPLLEGTAPAAPEAMPEAPLSTWELPGHAEGAPALLVEAAAEPWALWGAPLDQAPGRPAHLALRALALRSADGGQAGELGPMPGGAMAVASCGAGPIAWAVFATDQALRVLRFGEGWTAGETVGLRARTGPLALRMACEAGHVTVLWLDDDQTLVGLECDATLLCTGPKRLVTAVGAFDALRRAGHTIVAWTTAERGGPVSVGAVSPRGLSGRVPAACWSPQGGFCGTPHLTGDGRRVLLGVRDGADLLVVEAGDARGPWRAMTGLR